MITTLIVLYFVVGAIITRYVFTHQVRLTRSDDSDRTAAFFMWLMWPLFLGVAVMNFFITLMSRVLIGRRR